MNRLPLLLAILATPALAAERLLVFTHKGCPPCQRWHADYAEHPDMVGGREVVTHHDDAQAERRWKVRAVPTFVLVDGEREVRRRVGYQGRHDMERWLSRPTETQWRR
jgi:thioredoxin-related protein